MSDQLQLARARGMKTLESILAARHPDQTFVVELGEGQRVDRHGDSAAGVSDRQRPSQEDPHPILDRDNPTAPTGRDDDGVQKAA